MGNNNSSSENHSPSHRDSSPSRSYRNDRESSPNSYSKEDHNSNSKEKTNSDKDHNSNSPSNIKDFVSITADFIPIVSNFKGIYESIKGNDAVTGEKLSVGERIMAATSSIPGVPLVKGTCKASLKIAKNSGKVEKIVKNTTKIEKDVNKFKKLEKERNALTKTKTFTKEENIKYYMDHGGYTRGDIGGSGKPKYHNVMTKGPRNAEDKARNQCSHNKPPIYHTAHYDKVTGEKKVGPHYHPADKDGNPKEPHFVWEEK